MNAEYRQFNDYLSNHLSTTRNLCSRKHRKQWFSYNYKRLLPNAPDIKILEIGPGYGELLELLSQDCRYKNVKAIDMSQEVVTYCNQILPGCVEKVDNTVLFLEQHACHFDLIFMLQVLEHVGKPDVISLLEAAYNSLLPGGKLIIEVPNMANPMIGSYLRYADFTHEVGFTDLSLRYVLQCAGFSQVSLFESKVPNVSLGRIFQAGAQKLLNMILGLMIRIYMPNRKQMLSPTIYAVAIKSS
ncbi:Methyltransferase domain-containing protein [Gammaproteobacteria bacterium]